MYCIIDTKNHTYVIGEFQTVINTVYKWNYKNGILSFKVRDYELESEEVIVSVFNDEQQYTLIMNYLWAQLQRFDYVKARVVD